MWGREFGFCALLGRLELLAFQDPVGRGIVCCTLLLLGPASILCLQSESSEPFTYAASPEVQGPAVTLLIVLMLLALDSCNQAVLKVVGFVLGFPKLMIRNIAHTQTGAQTCGESSRLR